MKRQTNIQQVKEYDKNPPNQTKEEETESLPEIEYRIMIGKMIQNLENKMEKASCHIGAFQCFPQLTSLALLRPILMHQGLLGT